MNELTFLPWFRRGLAADIRRVDPGTGPVPRSPELDVSVEVDGTAVSSSVQIRPADHVVGIDHAQVSRRYPAPGATEVETGYWPLIDFVAPDLPWAMTPVAPNDRAHGSLRPWLVLVCVPEASATFTPAVGDRPASLTAATVDLPDLDRSALWAHVQSTVAFDDVLAATSTPGALLSRLVAPVALAPDTGYRVALVPAFTAVTDTELTPAWSSTTTTVTLAVFDTWTFRTGVASTFEEVVGLLAPAPPELDLNLGLRSVDVTDLGAIDPWPDAEQVVVDYAGALVDTDLDPVQLGRRTIAFTDAVIPLLNASNHRSESSLGDPDPVVTPPLYGAYATDRHAVPTVGWGRHLNLVPRHRMAAGLGAEIVRLHQERFMARAWEQAGEVMEARRALNATRLQAEIARTWKARTDRLDDAQHAAILRPQYTYVRTDYVRTDNVAARAAIGFSAIPNGLFDPVMLRATRRGSTVDRTASRRSRPPRGDDDRPPLPPWRQTLDRAFGRPAGRAAVGFGTVPIPRGAIMRGQRDVLLLPPFERPDTTEGTAASRFSADHPDSLELAATVGRAKATITPMRSSRARIDVRVRGLRALLHHRRWPADEVPTRFTIGPTIDEALVWALMELSTELLLPGVSEFPNNAVRLLEANSEFVAAFLCGVNHEMSRELLWREYPADLGSTTFHRFWDRPRGQRDIDDVAAWPEEDPLEEIGAGGGESVVVLTRGDVFRLYPTLLILLRDPDGVLLPPSFGGRIPPDIRFFAFDVTSRAEVVSGGWKVLFQEQLTEPRFGVDQDRTIDSRNSAHHAATSYQPPFSQEFDVVDLIGEGS